jgi:hypothetical protein
MLRDGIADLKTHLHDKTAPFGVDLLIPQVCRAVLQNCSVVAG